MWWEALGEIGALLSGAAAVFIASGTQKKSVVFAISELSLTGFGETR